MIKTCTVFLCLLWTTLLYSQTPQTNFTVAQMHSDVAILKDALTSLHPGIYRYLSQSQVDQYFDDIGLQTNKPLAAKYFYIKLAQLTAKLNCGHTYVNPYNQKKAINAQLQAGKVLPLLIKVIDKKIIVTHNLSAQLQIKPGDEVVSINGKPTKIIIDSLLTVSRSDGKHGLKKKLDNIGITPYLVSKEKYALFDIYFPLFFGEQASAEQYEILIKSHQNKKVTRYDLDLISKQMRQQRYQERFAVESIQPTGSFKLISSQCGYLKIRDFSTKGWGKNYERYLDSIFIQLKTIKPSQLIVDIRDNEGGDDEVRNKVISYLIAHPAQHTIRRYYSFLKVPDRLMPYLQTWDPSFKTPKLASAYEKTKANLYYQRNENSTESILPNQNHFTGKVYLLTNATNSSSSFFMADILQENKAAKLVGEATGGTKQGINGGQLFFLYLPSSGMEVDIPLIYQAPIKERKDEGVKPNITVKTTASDLAAGIDAPINYLIHRLRLSRKQG
jgi:C-terminal processing protease CtpA/Prc